MLVVLRAGVGLVELLATRRVAAAMAGREPDGVEVALVRLLGVRQLGQAGVIRLTHGHLAGPEVDLLHALSLVPVVMLSSRYRRAAGVSLLMATTFAALATLASSEHHSWSATGLTRRTSALETA